MGSGIVIGICAVCVMGLVALGVGVFGSGRRGQFCGLGQGVISYLQAPLPPALPLTLHLLA